MEESQNDVLVKATYFSDIEPDTLRKSSEHDKEKNLLKNPPVVLENHGQETNGHYFDGHGGDNDMERALQHQAQLIGQYEEEEKAQREWEEKFRESNIYTPVKFYQFQTFSLFMQSNVWFTEDWLLFHVLKTT